MVSSQDFSIPKWLALQSTTVYGLQFRSTNLPYFLFYNIPFASIEHLHHPSSRILVIFSGWVSLIEFPRT